MLGRLRNRPAALAIKAWQSLCSTASVRPTPYTLLSTPYTRRPTPYTSHPTL